jgi:hypothetical protein
MRNWRWERLLGGLAALSALTLAQALLPANEETMLRSSVFDAGHVLLFGLVALLALWILGGAIPSEDRGRFVPYGLALLLVVLLGLGTEFLQMFAERDAGLGDFVRDVIGGVAALLAAFALDRRRWSIPVFARVLVLILAATIAVAGMRESVFVYRDYGRRDASFPTLCGFDAPWEMRFVRGQNAELTRVPPPEGWDEARGQVGRLSLGRADYPGLALKETFPDWTGFDALEFLIWSEEPVELVVRVHDRAHDQRYTDRFNRTIQVAPGANRFRIPLEEIAEGPAQRRLDLGSVAGVAVFADRPAEPFTVWLDEIRLVRERNAP